MYFCRFFSRKSTPRGKKGSRVLKNRRVKVSNLQQHKKIQEISVFDLSILNSTVYTNQISLVSNQFEVDENNPNFKRTYISSNSDELTDSVFFIKLIGKTIIIRPLICRKSLDLLAVQVGLHQIVVVGKRSTFGAIQKLLMDCEKLPADGFMFLEDLQLKPGDVSYDLENMVSVVESFALINHRNLRDFSHYYRFSGLIGFLIYPVIFPDWRKFCAEALHGEKTFPDNDLILLSTKWAQMSDFVYSGGSTFVDGMPGLDVEYAGLCMSVLRCRRNCKARNERFISSSTSAALYHSTAAAATWTARTASPSWTRATSSFHWPWVSTISSLSTPPALSISSRSTPVIARSVLRVLHFIRK